MLMPSIFGENIMDDFFGLDYPYRGYRKVDTNSLMRTDVKEHEDGYEVEISLPGYKKEDIHAELKDGYLVIDATASQSNEKKDEKTGKYILQARYCGSCSRSFYVGEELTQEDIKAKYENGVLTLAIPKMEAKKLKKEKKVIAIEG